MLWNLSFHRYFFCYSIYQNNMTKTLCLGMKLGFLFFSLKLKHNHIQKSIQHVRNWISNLSSILFLLYHLSQIVKMIPFKSDSWMHHCAALISKLALFDNYNCDGYLIIKVLSSTKLCFIYKQNHFYLVILINYIEWINMIDTQMNDPLWNQYSWWRWEYTLGRNLEKGISDCHQSFLLILEEQWFPTKIQWILFKGSAINLKQKKIIHKLLKLYNLFKNYVEYIKLDTKIFVYRAAVLTSLLHDSEPWIPYRPYVNQLNVFQKSCF